MGDLINLNRFKKRIAREEAAKVAQANRTRFGRTKTERILQEHGISRANTVLDQHRIDGEDAS